MERKFTRIKEYKFEGTFLTFLEVFLKSYEKVSNLEGFILRFPDGYLLKAKLEEYKRLHRLITGFNEKDVWEAMKDGKLEQVLEEIPDEMYLWVKEVETDLHDKFMEIKIEVLSNMKDLGNRKDNAMYYQTCKYPSLMFNLLDGKNITPAIWRMIKPKVTQTFKVVGEDSN